MQPNVVRPTVVMIVPPPERRPRKRDNPIRRGVVDDTDILRKEVECEAARPNPTAGGQGEEAEAVEVVVAGRKEYLRRITPGSGRCKVRQSL